MTTIVAGTASVPTPLSADRAPAPLPEELTGASLDARQRELMERYHRLLLQPDAALRDGLAAMIRAEQALPEGERYAVTHARLKAWLALDREDARIIARAFDAAMDGFSREEQERRYAAERAAIMNGLRFSEFRALCGIVPWLRGESSLQMLFPEITTHEDDDPTGPLPQAA